MAIRVLVVDNNPVLLKAVSAMLERQGCLVQCAGTGLEALQILASFDPEMVVTDLIMPLVDGEQLCRILRQTPRYHDVFLVVLSAIIAEDEERIQRDTGCDLCIAKGEMNEMRGHLREAVQLCTTRYGGNSPEKDRLDSRIPRGVKPLEVTSELLSAKHHLAAILAHLDEGIVELSRDGRIVSANRAAMEMLGVREEMLIGADVESAIVWNELAPQVARWCKEQLLAGRRGQLVVSEEIPLRLNERVIVGSLLVVAEGGDFFGLCFLRDITRQYLAEEHGKAFDDALRLVKKMDAMSLMAGGVAHDFNNLLTVICGNLDILAHHGRRQDDATHGKLLEQARKAALAAVDLTRQISCFSNLGIVNREMTAIGPLLRRVTGKFFGQEEAFSLRLEDETAVVCVDGVEIEQAVINVLKNAVEAGSRRAIEITLQQTLIDEPCLLAGQYLSAGSYAKIDIRDFGRGIGQQQLFRVFDPYYSTKERGASKGMGLGLTVVYATMRNHGGHVVVHSELHLGTTVSLYLPIIEAERKPDGQVGSQGDKRCRVLMLEPDSGMREIGRIMLEHLGHAVTVAANRGEALAEVRRAADDPLLPRPLVLLDLASASGESAVETCRQLHHIDPELLVVAMSGSILDPVMSDCRRYGFVNTLTKPYTIDSLRHIVATVGSL
jgi:two-component system, cell cycle sensor histidine kinase and response regulator CckA